MNNQEDLTGSILQISICTTCGSTELVINSDHMNDFPSQYVPIRCRSCGEGKGIIGMNSLRDLLRSRDKATKKVAEGLMDSVVADRI